jgi:hypothetical protein
MYCLRQSIGHVAEVSVSPADADEGTNVKILFKCSLEYGLTGQVMINNL